MLILKLLKIIKYILPPICVVIIFTTTWWIFNWQIALLAVLIFYLAMTALIWLIQERLIFLRLRKLSAYPDFAQYDEISLTPNLTAPTEKIHGWFIYAAAENSTENAITILYHHGIVHNIAHRLPLAKILQQGGFNVFLYDYRGFGLSGGKPSEEKMYQDAQTAWNYLTLTRQISPSKIIIYGHSLGCGVALWLAERVNCAGVILEAAFLSLPQIAQRILPYLPAYYLCRPQFNNLSRINKIAAKILFIHSRNDELIPFRDGEKLCAQCGGEKYFLTLHGTHDHASTEEPEIYLPAVKKFINNVGAIHESPSKENNATLKNDS